MYIQAEHTASLLLPFNDFVSNTCLNNVFALSCENENLKLNRKKKLPQHTIHVYTVQPLYNSDPWESIKMAVMDRLNSDKHISANNADSR